MTMRLLPRLLAPVAALAAACQAPLGTSTGTGGGAGGRDSGACVMPSLGGPCAPTDQPCQPPDPCCAGYQWTCNAGSQTWEQVALGCACQTAPFPCGGTMCTAGEYCEILSGHDGGPPPVYTCHPYPESCGPADSCSCVENSVLVSTGVPCFSCNTDSAGHMTIHCGGT
jgi:hypothetical protein